MSGVVSFAQKRAEAEWRVACDMSCALTCFMPRHDNRLMLETAARLFPMARPLETAADEAAHFGENIFDRGQVHSMGASGVQAGIELKIAAFMDVVGQPVQLPTPYEIALIHHNDTMPDLRFYEVHATTYNRRGVHIVMRRELSAVAPHLYARIVWAAQSMAAQKPLWTQFVDMFKPPKADRTSVLYLS